MNKKKFTKAGVGLLVSALFITGAYAFLKNSETASKTNVIKAGTSGIVFSNQERVINLVDNSAIPMTKDYAIANLTSYKFDIENTGSVNLDYTISISSEGYSNTFPDGKINVLIAPITDDETEENIKVKLASATVQRVSVGKDLTFSTVEAGQHQKYALLAFIDRETVLGDYTGNSAAFKLEVNATQHTGISAENYENLTKSQIATSITAGGETKNVEVYNIEGDSKTDLLNKLSASGLTDTSTVDAIVEVKGEDYDGMNTTAKFDVSSIANPGDEVVILHYNETTQEWEFIGRETVAEDSTVTGDFTSYSPVAFIVYKPDGSIVTKEYDSDTGELIKETEVKTDGSTIETEYSNGEISNITESGNVSSEVNLSNINVVEDGVVLAQGDFSTKGNLVTINDTQYRVLAVDGTQAKVMSMESAGDSAFGDGTTTMFGSDEGQKYADSTLDQTMEAYYNGLPTTIQNAIIEQNINQSMYSWNDGINTNASFSAWYSAAFTASTTSGTNFYLTRVADINVGVRKVYALDVDDAIAYLGSSSSPQDVNELFWNQRSFKSGDVWLRSANSNRNDCAFSMNGVYGSLNRGLYNYSYEMRPVFVIDLSLLS